MYEPLGLAPKVCNSSPRKPLTVGSIECPGLVHGKQSIGREPCSLSLHHVLGEDFQDLARLVAMAMTMASPNT